MRERRKVTRKTGHGEETSPDFWKDENLDSVLILGTEAFVRNRKNCFHPLNMNQKMRTGLKQVMVRTVKQEIGSINIYFLAGWLALPREILQGKYSCLGREWMLIMLFKKTLSHFQRNYVVASLLWESLLSDDFQLFCLPHWISFPTRLPQVMNGLCYFKPVLEDRPPQKSYYLFIPLLYKELRVIQMALIILWQHLEQRHMTETPGLS